MGTPPARPRCGSPSLAASLASLLVSLLAALAGCQQPVTRAISYPADVRFSAGSDSLSLAAFLELPDALRRERARAADQWRARALRTGSLAEAMQALHTAVGLNPADAAAWLQIAMRRRWFGDYQQTEDALVACRAALPHQTTLRRALAAEAAICEAWLRYDRGEWRRGMAAVDSAAANGASGEAVDLLRALHMAGLGRDGRARDIALRFAGRDHLAHWIYGVTYWRRGSVQTAHGIFTGTASDAVTGTADFVKGQMRPASVGAAEAYRDFGIVEELLGNWWLAVRNYAHAARAVPWRDEAALRRIDHPALERGGARPPMPIWLAFDRYLVTGSLSAYTAFALQRFEAATTAPERDFWASAVLDAAGTCVRLDLHAAWARRARGLVLATFQGQQRRARQDLDAAQRWFENQRIEDLPTLAALGRLDLAADDAARAQALLARAVRLAPDEARLWSDLGLAHVRLAEPGPAFHALSRALELDENLAVAWYNRGLLRYHLADVPGAVADLQRAHDLAPDDQTIAALLDQLRRRLQP